MQWIRHTSKFVLGLDLRVRVWRIHGKYAVFYCQIDNGLLFLWNNIFRYAYFDFWLEASVQYVTMSVVSLLTIRQLGLLNNQQAIKMCHNSMKKMIQKITQNNWNFWTVNLIMRAKKIVIQLSDFPVRRTSSYRHKKALTMVLSANLA